MVLGPHQIIWPDGKTLSFCYHSCDIPPVCVSVCVSAPHISNQGICGTLQSPGEEGELSSEAFLVKVSRVKGQEVEVFRECTESVVATTMDDMTEWRLNCWHILRQEVVFHL